MLKEIAGVGRDVRTGSKNLGVDLDLVIFSYVRKNYYGKK